MRETMQFQLSGELETLGNHLIRYDDVRKKTIKPNPKKSSKKSEYPLGLPPLDQLIPHDVLPYGTKGKKKLSRQSVDVLLNIDTHTCLIQRLLTVTRR